MHKLNIKERKHRTYKDKTIIGKPAIIVRYDQWYH